MLMRATVLAVTLWAAAAAAAEAADRPDPLEGRRLAQGYCGGCHATGPSDKSPRLGAPPLRDLGQHYPIEDLQEALAEGIAVGHPEMPQVVWEARDIEAFMVYLRSLQPRQPRLRR